MPDRAGRIRRTGVVYGDPRIPAPASGLSVLGQIAAALLTIGIALGVAGVLGATLLAGARDDRGAAGAAGATPSAATSPSDAPSPSASSGPSVPSNPPSPSAPASMAPASGPPAAPASPSAVPAPSATPPTSLAPGLTPPPVASGIGSVVFGRSADGSRVADPSTTFASGETVVWIATLSAPQGSLPVVLEVYRIDEGDGQRIRRELVPVGEPGRTVLRREAAVSSLVRDPGLYEVPYSFDGDELATGRLLVTP